MTATLVDHLHRKRVLLILDNCEHLIQACAQFVEAVLRGCPRVCLLATSRELLGVAGERALPVPSLRTPNLKDRPPLESLPGYESVRLFVDRAAATTPHFALTRENALAVVQVCQRLDGIPLALELAAARLRMMPVEQLAAHLDDAFRLLTGGSRTALPRHQTLQALIDWSYDLLPEVEQTLLRRLAVFAGGWTLEAAGAVCAGEGLEPSAVAELLGRLIDKSLVLMDERAGAARYRLMETVRQYAQAKLAASGEADEVRRRHAEYYAALAETLHPTTGAMPQPAQLDQAELEEDNLRAVLGWSQLAPGRIELASRAAFGMAWFISTRGSVSEWRGWLDSLLGTPEVAQYPAVQAWLLISRGRERGSQGDYRAATIDFSQSWQLAQELGNRWLRAEVLQWLGWAAREQGDGAAAVARLRESQAIYQALGRPDEVTTTLAETLIMQGDLAAGQAMLETHLTRARQRQNLENMGWSLNHLGEIAQLQADYPRARQLHEASLAAFRQFGARYTGHIWAHQGLGEAALAQGEAQQAAAHFTEALAMSRDIGDREALAWCLAGLAGAAVLDEEPERAAWMWGAAEKLRLSLRVREAPASHATHERLKAQAREQIGEAAFAAHWAAGEAAPLSEAIEHALS